MTERILEIISHHPEGISPGAIISSSSSGESFAGKSIYVILNRLTREGRIKKENGLYSMSSPLKPSFVAVPGKSDCELFTELKREKPFSRLCIWHTDSFIPLMHDVPNISMTLVDAERNAVSAVIDKLCENALHAMTGSESFAIYATAFDRYSIGRKTLLRYAGRRNRREEVETILNEIGK